jgi:hypothetical protein
MGDLSRSLCQLPRQRDPIGRSCLPRFSLERDVKNPIAVDRYTVAPILRAFLHGPTRTRSVHGPYWTGMDTYLTVREKNLDPSVTRNAVFTLQNA